MQRPLENEIERVLAKWVSFAARRGGMVVACIALLAAVGLGHAVSTLSVNTDSREMVHPDEPYRVNARILDEAFPQIPNQMLAIIRAPTPDEADFVAQALSASLRRQPDYFSDVYAPGIDPFFQRQGLLFLSIDDLIETTSRLSSAAPLLENLIRDPSLPQFFEQLGLAARASEEGIGLSVVAAAYDEVARTVESAAAGDSAPLSWQRMFGVEEEINQRALIVQPMLDFSSLQPARPAVDALRRAVADLPELANGAQIHLTGDPVLRTEELKSVATGIEISAAVSLLLVSLLLAFGLRSWQLVVAALSALLASLFLTAGFAAWAIGELNLISIAFTVLLIGLGIDFSIHLVLSYREQRCEGVAHGPALEAMASEVGSALLLAAVTTAAAFFAFVPTKFIGMAQLGVISGTGVLIAFVVAMSLIPAILSILPMDRPRRRENRHAHRVGHGIEAAAKPIAVIAVLVGIAAAFLMSDVRFDADPMSLRDPKSPSVKAFNLLFDRPRDTPYRLNYLGEGSDEALAFAAKAEQLEVVEAAITLDDFVPENQEEKLAEIDFLAGDLTFVLTEIDEMPESGEASGSTNVADARAATTELIGNARIIAAQEAGNERGQAARRLERALLALEARATADPTVFLRLESALMRFFPMQMERLGLQMTARPVTMADLPPDIRRRYVSSNGLVRVEVVPAEDVRDPASRRAFVEAVAEISPRLAGGAFSVMRAAEVVADSMLQATMTAFALGALFIYAMIRSIRFTLVVLAPLALAALLTAAAGVLLGLPFNFANVIVLPLLIGLGVDSAIHLVMRIRRSGRARVLFVTSTPRAVLLSALTTTGSFGSLALSQHRGTASMGELLMIAIAFTLIATLIVLPGLMALVTPEMVEDGADGDEAGR